jgi:hypothetical protein
MRRRSQRANRTYFDAEHGPLAPLLFCSTCGTPVMILETINGDQHLWEHNEATHSLHAPHSINGGDFHTHTASDD